MESIRRNILALVGLVIGMIACVVLSGCTVRGDSGRLLGFEVGAKVSLGENTSAVATSKDRTVAGQQVTAHRPTAEAVTSSGRQGFQGLEVNHE